MYITSFDNMLDFLLSPFGKKLDVPMNLHLKYHQNHVSNSWDIADIEFVWVGGVVCTVIFMSNPT